MKIPPDAKGVYPIAPTPFLDDGSIDFESVDKLTDFYLGCGATGVTVLGQLGEAPKLEHGESVEVATRMIRRAAALPVIVGVSAPGFAAMRALTGEVMDAGAAGVMIAPPSTLRTDDQIVGYYRQAVEAIGAGVPFVIQDYPLTFTVQMAPAVISRIVTELPSMRDARKHEDWPGLEKISTLRAWERDCSMRRAPAILVGNGTASSSTTRWSAAPTARPTLATPFRTCSAMSCGLPDDKAPRGGARPARCAPAAAALRAATRHRPDCSQVPAASAWPAELAQAACAGGAAHGAGVRRGRAPARASGAARPARRARLIPAAVLRRRAKIPAREGYLSRSRAEDS